MVCADLLVCYSWQKNGCARLQLSPVAWRALEKHFYARRNSKDSKSSATALGMSEG